MGYIKELRKLIGTRPIIMEKEWALTGREWAYKCQYKTNVKTLWNQEEGEM